jgi:hypothetical protein
MPDIPGTITLDLEGNDALELMHILEDQQSPHITATLAGGQQITGVVDEYNLDPSFEGQSPKLTAEVSFNA